MTEPLSEAPEEEGNDQVVSTDVETPAPEDLEYVPENDQEVEDDDPEGAAE